MRYTRCVGVCKKEANNACIVGEQEKDSEGRGLEKMNAKDGGEMTRMTDTSVLNRLKERTRTGSGRIIKS